MGKLNTILKQFLLLPGCSSVLEEEEESFYFYPSLEL